MTLFKDLGVKLCPSVESGPLGEGKARAAESDLSSNSNTPVTLIRSFTQKRKKLVSTHDMPGTVLDAVDTARHNSDKIPTLLTF